jgi:hypothetical protein
MKNSQLKKFAPILLIIGILLFVFGLLYNATQVLNATAPFGLTSLYALGYIVIVAATFMLGKKKIGYGLVALGILFVLWFMVQVLSIPQQP